MAAKPKQKSSGKVTAKDGKEMRKELKKEQAEMLVQDAGLKSMGYKKGGMVKGACKECGKKPCACKRKGYMCGGKVKK